jgi:hypothetical protein
VTEQTTEAHDAEAQATEEPAVLPPNRNGYSVVVGRLVDLSVDAKPVPPHVTRHALLSRADETMLRDADQRQLGSAGSHVAHDGTREEWRAFLREHFRRTYDLVVLFDAPKTTVE